MVIKKIFAGVSDEEVHDAFIKFGKGEFSSKYIVEAKKQKDKYSIKTSAEYANFLVKKCLSNQKKLQVTGIIVSTIDLSKEIPFPVGKVSNFQGIRKIPIESEVNAEDVLKLMDKYPRMFFALSFKTENLELKVKPKAPKSAKPGKDLDEAKADFCSLKTSDKSVVDELVFDAKDFKDFRAEHTIKINDILYPRDPSLSPVEVREMSKRKGVVIRKVTLDGKEIVSEAKFEA